MKFNLVGTKLKSKSLDNKKKRHNIHNNKVNDLRYLKYLSKEWTIKKILQNMNIRRYYNKIKQGVR